MSVRSKRSHEGVLIIDNRASPGVSPEFVRAAGVATPAVGEGAFYECPTVTCSHCNTVVMLNPQRTRPRGYCRKCDHYVCDNPECNKECRPFKAVLDAAQEDAVRQQQLGIIIPPSF